MSRNSGQLSGSWNFLHRFAVGTYPLVLGWAVWVTAEVFTNVAFRATTNEVRRLSEADAEKRASESFTKADAALMRADIIERLGLVKESIARIEAKMPVTGK